ncbi:MAG: DUF992 domain-containing protein [Rhodospirillales bacterium]|nr:DUF992 domain-containing protein [Rhodospirillales bacterium]
MLKSALGFVLALGFGLLSVAAPASVYAQSGVNVGVLTCKKIPGGVNLIIHSVTNIECEFSNGNGKERYKGETGVGLGIDLEWNQSKNIAYTVISATKDIRMGSHSLAGKYAGAKASASAVVGVGAQVLVGGGNNNFTLQPLALEASTGLGAAAGIGYLYLEAGN